MGVFVRCLIIAGRGLAEFFCESPLCKTRENPLVADGLADRLKMTYCRALQFSSVVARAGRPRDSRRYSNP